jgi:hypothetical protein
MADGKSTSIFSDALTDFLLPAMGIRFFMRRTGEDKSDPTLSSQDEFLFLQALESLEPNKADLKKFIMGYLEYLKRTHETRKLPRFRETIARAAGKDGAKPEKVRELLEQIFEDKMRVAVASIADGVPLMQVYEKLNEELDLILTQRFSAAFKDRANQVTGWLKEKENESCDAADEFAVFMRERKERKRTSGD